MMYRHARQCSYKAQLIAAKNEQEARAIQDMAYEKSIPTQRTHSLVFILFLSVILNPLFAKEPPTTQASIFKTTPHTPTSEPKPLLPKNGDAPGSLQDSVLLGFGWLTTGIPSDSVFKYLGRPDSNLIFYMSGIESAYQAEAEYLQKGMTVGFTSADTNETAVVRNFWLRKPCTLQTAFGIGVGSRVDSLRFHLGKLIHAEHPDKIWIGNDYYASVFFHSNNRIDSIFVGQIAE